MWTPTTRRQHSRAALRYGSDATDAAWQQLEWLLPADVPRGRKRSECRNPDESRFALAIYPLGHTEATKTMKRWSLCATLSPEFATIRR